MGETSRMHFVPRVYLKRFAQEKNGAYYINVLSEEIEKNQIFPTNITNVCVEKDIYKLPGATEDM